MSYEPTNWKTGDVVTSAKLNKLEEGVANSGAGFLKVTVSYDDQTKVETLGKTWQEIRDALDNGEYVSMVVSNPETHSAEQMQINVAEYTPVVEIPGTNYHVFVVENPQRVTEYTCDTANGYPSRKDA